MNWNDVKYGRKDDKAAIDAKAKYFFDWAADCATSHTHGGGQHYNDVINAVKANWVGPDADAFINNFKNRIAALANELKTKYRAEFEEIVKSEMTSFNAAQAKNADQMKF